jgi:Asp-tRNA(Asn)/Glu-tRNA(Gln) amidotransferase A subunit family amidase
VLPFGVARVQDRYRLDCRRWQARWASNVALRRSSAAPIGLSPERLPLSVQIVGPQYGDLATIRFAQLIEREYYGFVVPGAYA